MNTTDVVLRSQGTSYDAKGGHSWRSGIKCTYFFLLEFGRTKRQWRPTMATTVEFSMQKLWQVEFCSWSENLFATNHERPLTSYSWDQFSSNLSSATNSVPYSVQTNPPVTSDFCGQLFLRTISIQSNPWPAISTNSSSSISTWSNPWPPNSSLCLHCLQ
jgi:hypothetical protein